MTDDHERAAAAPADPTAVEPPAAPPAPGPDELRRATEVLEAAVADRVLLAGLSHEDRKRLLVAAGRVVHPDIVQKRRLVRALRQTKRRRDDAHDRAAVASTGIREAKRLLGRASVELGRLDA